MLFESNMNLELCSDPVNGLFASDLARLRSKASMSQSKVAKLLNVDSSRISRIETGAILPEPEEIGKLVKAIGTPEALEYASYQQERWNHLKKPSFWHPDRIPLRQAEDGLRELDEFTSKSQVSSLAQAQSKLYSDTLQESADYLSHLDHALAFVGEIGVGKSTAICFLTDLLLPTDARSSVAASKRVVLETGAGRTTLCEVQVRTEGKNTFGLVLHPHSQDEIFRTVRDFCDGLIDTHLGRSTEHGDPSETRGVSEETAKALRNMAGLARKLEKAPDGKSVRQDPAADLARSCNGNAVELTAEVVKRMNLQQRTKTEFRFEQENLSEGLRRLKELFADVNKGLCSDVSLPSRMDVIVPLELLGHQPFSISIIDTKGADGTAIRPDIRAYVDNPRTLTILCSGYRSAPDISVRQLLENLANTGAERITAERVILLILARAQEVLDTPDDVGTRPDTPEEGYRIKADQIAAKLSQIKGAEKAPVVFYDVLNDDPRKVVDEFSAQIRKTRNGYTRRIEETCQAIRQLIQLHGAEETKRAQAEVQRRLRIFVKQHMELESSITSLYREFATAILAAHPRTVWATTRRNGTWPGLDAYLHIGTGAAIDAQLRSQPAFAGLEELISNMLGDKALAPAWDYLNELRRNVPNWKAKFLSEATASARETYRAELFSDDAVWDACASVWGSGRPFRAEVQQQIADWCDEHSELTDITFRQVAQAWRDRFLMLLAGLCQSADLFEADAETTETA
jgi:transcriptional regulator with XRE-family HTH domain